MSDVNVHHQVLCGKAPYAGCARNITLEILGGGRPSKPDAAVTLGFTDELWWIVNCCWLEDHRARPGVKAVLILSTPTVCVNNPRKPAQLAVS